MVSLLLAHRRYYSGCNTAVSYFAARTVCDGLYCLFALSHSLLDYAMVGFSLRPTAFAWYCVTLFTLIATSGSIGVLCSSFSTNLRTSLNLSE